MVSIDLQECATLRLYIICGAVLVPNMWCILQFCATLIFFVSLQYEKRLFKINSMVTNCANNSSDMDNGLQYAL